MNKDEDSHIGEVFTRYRIDDRYFNIIEGGLELIFLVLKGGYCDEYSFSLISREGL